ncbi:hypothetical protein V5738_05815 [Salinisphaera sp. SPP-AMP-43]|uniref:hypothetical protein n=1 Tax=Salinisphaera sp. SPP-AMP-43 TaxID=3121288 RepID=UPI003C6E8CD9
MTEGNLPTPDDASGKRRRRLLARKRLYQRFWGGRTANETPVVVFLTGNPDIGRGYIVDAFERNFETDVYRSDDARAFSNGELKSEEALRRLIGRSRAPAMVFVASHDAQAVGGLVEHFSPARALWFFQDYRRFIERAKQSGDLPAAREYLHELSQADAEYAGGRLAIPDDVAALLSQQSLTEDTVWGLVWYTLHARFRSQKLDRSHQVHLVSEDDLLAAPQAVMNCLFEMVGIATMGHQLKRRVKTPRRSRQALELPGALQQACDELLDWLKTHSVDASEHS